VPPSAVPLWFAIRNQNFACVGHVREMKWLWPILMYDPRICMSGLKKKAERLTLTDPLTISCNMLPLIVFRHASNVRINKAPLFSARVTGNCVCVNYFLCVSRSLLISFRIKRYGVSVIRKQTALRSWVLTAHRYTSRAKLM
jgi:hypothetical protein